MRDWETRFFVGVAFVVGAFIFTMGAALTGALLETLSLFERPRMRTGWFYWYLFAAIGGTFAVCAYLALLEKYSEIGGPWTGTAGFFAMIRDLIAKSTSALRLWLAFSLLWVVLLVVALVIFEPFGRYWDRGHWVRFLTLLVGPVLGGLVGVRLVIWATRGRISPGGHASGKQD